MSTTTQILFNSPALHSLKRDQLVKLCKIHAIKASGKSVDLIERLKKHAETLPRDSPLSVATRSEDATVDFQEQASEPSHMLARQMPRPSEQWEVVMESIEELEESSSQGTLSSLRTAGSGNGTGEFGTGGSKSTSVSSSLKAFATSLGLKRSTAVNSNTTVTSTSSKLPSSPYSHDLTQHSVPYSSLPPPDPSTLPQIDHLTFAAPDASTAAYSFTSDSDPIPGHALRPGLPAPSNARLSMGTTATPGATTTIRLVAVPCTSVVNQPSTPQLRPFETTFDLLAGSPSAGAKINVWPSEDNAAKLYPTLPAFGSTTENTEQEDDVDMPGGLTFSHRPSITQTPVKTAPPMPNTGTPTNLHASLNLPAVPPPFIFGSPLPQHRLSNQQFRNAAATVLEEMNRRLADKGIEAVGLDILEQPQQHAHGSNPGDGPATAMAAASERFDLVHEREFNKMESITSYAARREVAPGGRGKKRKSSVGAKGKGRPSGARVAGTRVISGGRRKMAMPGGFGEGDDDEVGEDDRRLSKRPRVEDEAEPELGKDKGKRVSIAPAALVDDEVDEKEERKRQKEREAIRRKLDMNKARRRSSMGRVSVGGKGPLNQKKGITSRFGFLSSAKSMVQSVWNRGIASSSKQATTSSIPLSSKRSIKAPAGMVPPPPKPAAPVTTQIPSMGSKGSSLLSRVASSSGRLLKPTGTATSTATGRSRSPIPSFTRPPSVSGSTRSAAGSRVGSLAGTTGSRAGTGISRNGSIAGASSIGTRSSVVGSRVSSLGTRSSLASTGSMADPGSNGVKRDLGETSVARKRVSSSSRLLAPTASSLAKAPSQNSGRGGVSRPGISQQKVPSPLAAVQEDRTAVTLEPITNNPGLAARRQLQSPQTGRIFSKPLASPSSIPTPARNATFANAGSADADIPALAFKTAEKSTIAPLKPKVLTGRKPRISRSRVIARLASQRAASNSSSGTVGTGGGLPVTGRTRSSFGAGKRKSFGGVKGARGSDVVMSAKKRARQSEYARRKSRVAVAGKSETEESGAMDVETED